MTTTGCWTFEERFAPRASMRRSNDSLADPDADGLTHFFEFSYETVPYVPDADGGRLWNEPVQGGAIAHRVAPSRGVPTASRRSLSTGRAEDGEHGCAMLISPPFSPLKLRACLVGQASASGNLRPALA